MLLENSLFRYLRELSFPFVSRPRDKNMRLKLACSKHTVKATSQGLCSGATVWLGLARKHVPVVGHWPGRLCCQVGAWAWDQRVCICALGVQGEKGRGSGRAGAETDRRGDRERNQSYTQTPRPVISFHRRCQADAWSPRCLVCGRWALWSAGRRREGGPCLPGRPPLPSCGLLGRGPSSAHGTGSSGAHSPPPSSCLFWVCFQLQVTSAVLRRRVQSGFPPVGRGPGGTLVGQCWACGVLQTWNLTPCLAVFLLQWLSQLHMRLWQRPGTISGLGACASGRLWLFWALFLPGAGPLLPWELLVPERVSRGPGASCGAWPPPRSTSLLAFMESSRTFFSVLC